MKTEERKFLSIEKIVEMEEYILFLSNWKNPKDFEAYIKIDDIESKLFTDMLYELGQINLRREEIIQTFKTKNETINGN
jgi:hypothetical protein